MFCHTTLLLTKNLEKIVQYDRSHFLSVCEPNLLENKFGFLKFCCDR